MSASSSASNCPDLARNNGVLDVYVSSTTLIGAMPARIDIE
jgi:hypothetical protein